jgi:hypothetical protein
MGISFVFAHLGLAQDHAAGVIQRGEQVMAVLAVVGGAS